MGTRANRLLAHLAAFDPSRRGLEEGVDVLLCTVEKANVVVNRLIEEGRLNELGLVVLDEVHMLAEEGRGYLLELLLTKLRVLSRLTRTRTRTRT